MRDTEVLVLALEKTSDGYGALWGKGWGRREGEAVPLQKLLALLARLPFPSPW